MSDLLYSVSLVRKSLQKKRQQRKELSLNFTPSNPFDSERSKTERNGRPKLNQSEKSQISELVTSPVNYKKFEFNDGLSSPNRFRSYKIDAANLLISRIKNFLKKQFFIWKKKIEYLRNEENEIFNRKASRLKVSVGKYDLKAREIINPQSMAGKIIRKSQENINQLISKITSSIDLGSDEDQPIIEPIQPEKQKPNTSSIYNTNSFSSSKYSGQLVLKKKNREKALKKLFKVLEAKVKPFLSHFFLKNTLIKNLQKTLSQFVYKRLKPIFSLVITTDTKETDNTIEDKKSYNRNNFEECIQSLKNFISQKRNQKNQKNKDLNQVQYYIGILEGICVKNLLFYSIFKMKLFTNNHLVNFVKLLEKFYKQNERKIYTLCFSIILSYPQTLKNYQRLLKLLIKNINKDILYRTEACFKHWKSFSCYLVEQQELTSLSAISIHNILLNLINCRTKVFFAAYSLAHDKYNHSNQNIKKGMNRLSLCIRDHQHKYFLRWKSASRSYILHLKSNKKSMNGLERSIKAFIFNTLQDSFNQILVFIKIKRTALRLFNKTFLRGFKAVFKDLRSSINLKYESENLYSSNTLRKPLRYHIKDNNNKLSESSLRYKTRKFTFKFLCNCLNRLNDNLSFHHNSLKKNAIIKWKIHCINSSKLQSIKIQYTRDINCTVACTILSRTINMIIISSIRFSYIKLLRY
jgi:hypothetical protein